MPHDVLFGAVEPAFETPQRATTATRQLFSRRVAEPTGADLVAYGPNKTLGVSLGSGNTIFRRATTLTDDEPFQAAFGAGGGEDYDLFCRLQDRGRRFGWLPEATALEFVPAARCDPAYLRARFYAGGQAFAAAVAGVSPRPGLARWVVRAKAALQAGALAAKAPLLALSDREARLDYGYRWAGVLGKLSLGAIHPIYHIASPPQRAGGVAERVKTRSRRAAGDRRAA